MTVALESRGLMSSDTYAPMGDLDHDASNLADHVRFTDQDVADLNSYEPSAAQLMASPEVHHGLDLSSPPPQPQLLPSSVSPARDEPELRRPQRIKSVPKPDRQVTKNDSGKYVCAWADCTDDLKEFQRKCEWNKHMDKHERPYKCPAEGCEKLPGFTYSGGLLRHEREVHSKHGGPKTTHNCPHLNCKRHQGKGFSRLENLNEHMRRVHTQNPSSASPGDEEPDENASVDTTEPPASVSAVGEKRKAEDDTHEENKRLKDEMSVLRDENDYLKEQVEAMKRQHIAMMAQVAALQAIPPFENRITNIPAALLDETHSHF